MKNFLKISSLSAIFVFAVFAFSGCEKKADTTGWRTYKDDAYGYQFKAPKDWKVEKGKDEQTGLVVLKDEKGIQQMTISATQKTENEKEFKGLCYQQNSKQCDKADHGTIQFSAGTGYVYDDSLAVEPRNRRFIILDNERLTFSLVNEDAGKERTIDQIISTIDVESERREIDKAVSIREFLDGEYQFEDVDTSNWETYRNEEYGFKVKIPQGWGCDETYNENDSSLVGVEKKTIICLDNRDREEYLSRQESVDKSGNEDIALEYYENFSFNFFDGYANSLTRLYAPNDLGINQWMFTLLRRLDNKREKRGEATSIRESNPIYSVEIDGSLAIFIRKENLAGVEIAHNYNFLSINCFPSFLDGDFDETMPREKVDGMLQSFEFIN